MVHNENSLVDTNVIIRLLTSDDIKKQHLSQQLFEKVAAEKITIYAPVIVISEAVYVLSSMNLYNIARKNIRTMLVPLLELSSFKVENKQVVIEALDIYVSLNIDFEDAYLAAAIRKGVIKTIYSFDKDFDKITGVRRLHP